MQYKITKKIIIDEQKLTVLIRLGCPDDRLLSVIKTGKFEKTGDNIIDEILESFIDRKEFKNWGGNHNPKGINNCKKIKKLGQVDNQVDNQVECQVVDKDKDNNNININILNNNNNNNNKKFIKPSLDEVISYCLERKNNVNPEKWYDYYSANGWKVGRNPMKDWKATVRTWEKNEYNNNQKPKLSLPDKISDKEVKQIIENRIKDDEERKKNYDETNRRLAFLQKKGYKSLVSLISAGKETYDRVINEYKREYGINV